MASLKELRAMLARCRDLDILYTRTYEDNASGKVSDERFMMISKRYDEQPALKKKISALQAVIMNIRHAAASRKSAYLHVGQGRYLPVGLPKNPAPGQMVMYNTVRATTY